MKNPLLNDERNFFEAFIKTEQYIATLTTPKGIMNNLEKLVKKFYNSDFFAFYEGGADGTIIEHRNNFSNTQFSKNVLEKIEEIAVQVLESGFFASELINPSDPYAMVFLPISKANQIISVIVIGHKYSERLPKYFLNIYLALGRLIGTTIEKLTMIQELKEQQNKLKKSEDELMKHQDHLEKLVEIRTEELKESEERFRELANSLPQVISEADERGNLTFVNKNAYNVFGYTPDDFNKGLNALQMFIPEDRNRVMESIKIVLRGRSEEEMREKKFGFTALRKDGSTFPVMVYSNPIIYKDTSLGLRTIMIDITDRRKAEQKLKESEEKFRKQNVFLNNILESLTHPFYVINAKDYTIALANSTASSAGFEHGQYCYSLSHNNIKPCEAPCVCPLNEVKNTKKSCVVEHKHYDKEGNEQFYEIYGYPILDESGNVVQMIEYALNITNRKIAQHELKDSEERYRELANSLPQVICEMNERGNLAFINTNAYSVYGYTPDDFNKGLNAIQMVIPEDRKRAMENMKRILRRKEEDIIGDNEYTALRKDGSTFPVIIYSSPIVYKYKSVGMRSIIIDITDQKKAEKELNNALEDLHRSNTELEQFAYIASHDLQEPLRMVASFTQLLQSRYQDKLDDEANEFINFAVDGATRMQGLINDLLTFSRIGTKGISFNPTDMNIVLENVLANIRQSTIEADAIITNDPLPVIIADESQMVQLLQNLISNAIKFHGPVPPKIHITGEVKKDEWIFTVRDNGIGIDSKNFERIFIIFQRFHEKGEYLGTGIGLAICKKIIQRHGGKIWVESELKKGSTFYFTISRNRNGVSNSKKVSKSN